MNFSQRRAGLRNCGTGPYVNLPMAWTELAQLAQCKGKIQEGISNDALDHTMLRSIEFWLTIRQKFYKYAEHKIIFSWVFYEFSFGFRLPRCVDYLPWSVPSWEIPHSCLVLSGWNYAVLAENWCCPSTLPPHWGNQTT